VSSPSTAAAQQLVMAAIVATIISMSSYVCAALALLEAAYGSAGFAALPLQPPASSNVHAIVCFTLPLLLLPSRCTVAAVTAGDASQQQRVQQLVLKVTNAVHSNIPGFLEVRSSGKWMTKFPMYQYLRVHTVLGCFDVCAAC
jgi:hypothetical protein